MKKDERCPNFDDTIVSKKSWEDGDDKYLNVVYACGCFRTVGDENTPGFRDHWDYYVCKDCKKNMNHSQ